MVKYIVLQLIGEKERSKGKWDAETICQRRDRVRVIHRLHDY